MVGRGLATPTPTPEPHVRIPRLRPALSRSKRRRARFRSKDGETRLSKGREVRPVPTLLGGGGPAMVPCYPTESLFEVVFACERFESSVVILR
jgi:hypothetical protein